MEYLRNVVQPCKILSESRKVKDSVIQDIAQEVSQLKSRFLSRGENADGVHGGEVVLGLAAVAVAAVGIKSVWTMVSWRMHLRDNETKRPAAGPTPLPFLGNMLELRSGYYEALYRFVDKPASVFWVMSTPFVVVNEEEGLRRVLGGAGGLYQKPKYFGYRSKTVKNIVQSEREKVASESISYEANGDTSRVALENMVVSSLDSIKASMVELLKVLEHASAKDSAKSESEAVGFIRRAIVALNLHVLFGVSKDKDGGEDANRIASMIEFAGTEFAQRMVNPLKVFVDVIGNFRYARDVTGLINLGRRLCTILDETASHVIDKARDIAGQVKDGAESVKTSCSGLSWVHAWVGKVGKIGKLGKVVGLLMASTQTVPLTAVWMLHLVANNKSVRDDLRRELKEAAVHSLEDLDYDNAQKLVLADAVIKETLRLYPPFPLIQRQVQSDDILSGITVPSGTIVYVVPWLVHRNKRYWCDAHAFKPERFLQNSSHGDAPSDWVYLPFGRGARMCAGSKLALTELKVLLCAALLAYEWESTREGCRDERFPQLGMVPEGVKMRFRSRFMQ